ncbi:MAG: rhomboid family intramembrane serine protease [Flavobacteriaceae bacterium]
MGRITETVKVLIICNVLFFVGKLTMQEGIADRLFSLYYFQNPNFHFWQIITHMFMHGSFGHILFNMLGLYMFGSPLEARWGRNKFLFFYFSAGLGAALIHTFVNYVQFHSGFEALSNAGISSNQIIEMINDAWNQAMNSPTGAYSVRLPESVDINTFNSMASAYKQSALGASGAIYGVLVAFGMMYPNAELMLIFFPVPIKAKYFIPGLLLLDFFSGVTGFSIFGQNIANWAHLGGALFGFLMAYYWKKNSFNDHRWD